MLYNNLYNCVLLKGEKYTLAVTNQDPGIAEISYPLTGDIQVKIPAEMTTTNRVLLVCKQTSGSFLNT